MAVKIRGLQVVEEFEEWGARYPDSDRVELLEDAEQADLVADFHDALGLEPVTIVHHKVYVTEWVNYTEAGEPDADV